jgi:hypothetical protein
MATDSNEQYKRLRQYLAPSIKGKNTEAVLTALATPAAYLINSVESVHDQLYIASAVDRYLDQRLADYNLVRPPKVGLSDDVFRGIGIDVVNRKQIRDLLNNLLSTIFGEELTQATSKSAKFEPYDLDDGDTILIKFDGGQTLSVTFESSQFANINLATAQEVADAITRSIRAQGKSGRAFSRDDGSGGYVVLISDTIGPSSSVAVFGGRAQNELVFDKPRPTSTGASTQWTITPVSGGGLRFTWSGGGNPSIGKIRLNDYVNIYGGGFNVNNQGTYTITNFKGGAVNSAFFEVENPNGVSEIATQGVDSATLFFQPFRHTINTKTRYAAIYQEEARLLEIFIPATTKVVRRDRKGAAHMHGEANIVTEAYNPGLNEVTDVTVPAKAAISDGQYFLLASAQNTILYYAYFDTTGGNLVDPAIPGRTGIRVNISSAVTATDVAVLLANILNGQNDFGSAKPATPTVRIANKNVGASTNISNGNVPGLVVALVQNGVNTSTTTTSVPNPDEGFPDTQGPYMYDTTQPFVVSDVGSLSTIALNPDSGRIIPVVNANAFPDEQGFLILGLGTSHQEGPIPYLARPSSTSILLNPSYRIRNDHPIGTDVALVAQTGPVVISREGSDYPFYLTDVVAGRIYAEELIKEVSATGINVVITILFPSDEGLGKWGTEYSEKTIIWGD